LNLVVVDLRHIVRSVEAERPDVEAAGGAEQRIGGDYPPPLRTDEPRAAGREILLGVEDVERCALGSFLAQKSRAGGNRARGRQRALDSISLDSLTP
jgi:hypothetical protein